MKWKFAAAIVLAIIPQTCTPAYSAEQCGNMVHNIIRARECEAYTTDWEKHKDLRDARARAFTEWSERLPLAGQLLSEIIKEADLRRAHGLARDMKIHPDGQMYEMRGCGQLPLCGVDGTGAPPTPEKQVRNLEKPQPRNRRTGKDYCGPRDRARGYCD